MDPCFPGDTTCKIGDASPARGDLSIGRLSPPPGSTLIADLGLLAPVAPPAQFFVGAVLGGPAAWWLSAVPVSRSLLREAPQDDLQMLASLTDGATTAPV